MTRILSIFLLVASFSGYAAERTIEGKHLRVALNQSADTVARGEKVTLTAQVKLPAGMHVYAPSIGPPYKPITLSIESPAGLKISAVRYPEGKKLHLEAIDETVPVYEGTFTLEADATVSRIAKTGDLTISGKLNYQTCDDKICYLPVTLPVTWIVKVAPATHSGK